MAEWRSAADTRRTEAMAVVALSRPVIA